MIRPTRPLFQCDPGWLFVLAGLAVCAAGILLPAQADLQALQRQLDLLRDEELQAYARLKAHADFLDEVDRSDAALVRRLAAAQLNMIPEGDKPILLAAAHTSPVTDWIDATVNIDIRPPKPAPVSMLSSMANGPKRLWMLGGGILCVFVGLMMGNQRHGYFRADALSGRDLPAAADAHECSLRTDGDSAMSDEDHLWTPPEHAEIKSANAEAPLELEFQVRRNPPASVSEVEAADGGLAQRGPAAAD